MTILIPADAAATSTVRITREPLHLDDVSKLGANAVDYSYGGDQAARFQAGLNLAAAATNADGEIFIAGEIKLASFPTVPSTRAITVFGAGAEDGRSQLTYTGDLGPGMHAFVTGTGGASHTFRDFNIQGTGSGGGAAGSMPCQMGGVFAGTQAEFTNVGVHGFGWGVGLVNDHQEFHRCNLQGNGYAVNHLCNPFGGLGDQYWERNQFTNQTRASIAICDTNAIANARYIQGHIGSAPFGFYVYPAGQVPATGSNASATLTGVRLPPWFPIASIDGMAVAGTNIPPGTTVSSHSGPAGNYTLGLSATPTGIVTDVYFPNCEWAATGSVGAGPTLTNVNIPQWVPMGSAQGATIKGVNIPNGTTITSVAGVPGNYTLGISNTPTGPVVGIIAPPRGIGLAGVVLENHSLEYCGHAVIWDEGRNRSSFSNVVFDSPGEFGTGGAAKWPGKMTPCANYEVGTMGGWHWRDNSPAAQSDVPGQPYIRANSINNIRVDVADSIGLYLAEAAGIAGHKSFRIRTVAEGGITAGNGGYCKNFHLGHRGGPGVGAKHCNIALASEAVTKGDLLELFNNGGVDAYVRPSRNGATSMICGVALMDYVADDLVVYATQYDAFWFVVRNLTTANITNGTLLKPDKDHQGGVAPAANLNADPLGTIFPVLGYATQTITAGSTGTANIRIP